LVILGKRSRFLVLQTTKIVGFVQNTAEHSF
jgi:hypothetical protein